MKTFRNSIGWVLFFPSPDGSGGACFWSPIGAGAMLNSLSGYTKRSIMTSPSHSAVTSLPITVSLIVCQAPTAGATRRT